MSLDLKIEDYQKDGKKKNGPLLSMNLIHFHAKKNDKSCLYNTDFYFK